MLKEYTDKEHICVSAGVISGKADIHRGYIFLECALHLLNNHTYFNKDLVGNIVQQEIIIYTDGSCSPNPGDGGWAGLLIFEGKDPVVLQGSAAGTTNNRMELTAPIEALRSLAHRSEVMIITDSTYVKDGITSWIQRWEQQGWVTVDGEDVKNKDLWQTLLSEIKRHNVSWKWVKGHADDQYNLLVDQLAVEACSKKTYAKPSKDSINIYLGVTCKHSTRTGGWAVILEYKEKYKILGQGEEQVTANVLYLDAVINGLSALKRVLPVQVFTSSGYIKDGATSWLPGWEKRGWLTRDAKDVANKEKWQQLAALQKRYDVSYHLTDKRNPLCYMLEAKELAKEFEIKLQNDDENSV